MREAVISFPSLGLTLDPPSYISIGNFHIYFYGIIIALGFVLAVLYTAGYSAKRLDISMDDVYDLMLFAVPSAIIGARLYYVIFYFSLYQDNLLKIFAIRDGGLAIYGGVIGAVLALFFRCRRRKIGCGKALDVAAFGLLIGQCVGRWGNFFNREAFGYETDCFFRMGLTMPGQETIYVHPTFLYESLWNFVGFWVLHFICRKNRKYEGQFFILYVMWYGLGRAFIEGLRSDSLWLIPGVVRVSQMLAIISLLAAGTIYIINSRRMKKGLAPLVGKAVHSNIDGDDIMEGNKEDASSN